MPSYRLKNADLKGNTVLVFSPVELLVRVSSLIQRWTPDEEVPGHPGGRRQGPEACGSQGHAPQVRTSASGAGVKSGEERGTHNRRWS